ncbi:Hypothetical predicted protein [Mytilus galloprovincialis]|uniref:B box-type domain-containing protein n=1 Tax=Mytilus galloprovincialis TaxID=29158 RepID=A0A8B6DF29_MYTGA|nr:Hypothetical predicted protein [Mytilus galloprovincialis]
MAAIDKYFCSLCPDVGTFTEAVTWCTECAVFLCRDCEKHHQGSGMLKTHKTISKNDYHTLSSTFIPHLVYLYRNIPECMQKVSSQCRDHEKTFELYCSFHACPCCRQCVTYKHQKCHEIKPIADILMPVKLSASVKKIDKNLKILHENIDKITEYLKGRIISNYDQKTKAIEEIQAMRKSIDEYLNKLEEKYLDDLESKHSKLKSQINTLLVQMKQQADHIAQLKNEFSKMTQYGTELQLLIGLQGLEKTTCEAAKKHRGFGK